MPEQLLKQEVESLVAVIPLVAKIDERTMLILDKIDKYEQEVHGVRTKVSDHETRLTLAEKAIENLTARIRTEEHEKRLTAVETTTAQGQNRWKTTAAACVQILQGLALAYLAYRLGIRP